VAERPDAFAPPWQHHGDMQKSYGVVWREGDAPVVAGKLELLPRGLRLEGRERAQEIPYGEVEGVHVGRSPEERLDGRASVVVERRSAAPLTMSTVAQPSLVGEIAERLAQLQLGARQARRLAVVLPVRPESRPAVRALLEAGPPFDPDQVAALDRHEVFLTSNEVVFVFESPLGPEALMELLATPDVWQAASAWREHLAGAPRIAEDAFSWERPEPGNSVHYLPTPGPGDSDGGDIY
jgi:hypothetical protein